MPVCDGYEVQVIFVIVLPFYRIQTYEIELSFKLFFAEGRF